MQLPERMKLYEKVTDYKLTCRMPIIARVDGISFSKYTKLCAYQKPHDYEFLSRMLNTVTNITNKISGVVFAYQQSDEISFLLKNDQTFETEPYASNRIQKLVSHLAAYATCGFNENRSHRPPGAFDCRIWTIPEADINNYFVWRQKDTYRNCIQGIAHYKLQEKFGREDSLKLIKGKKIPDLLDILEKELNFRIDDYPTYFLRGITWVKTSESPKGGFDGNPPIFSEKPSYIENQYFKGVTNDKRP